MTALDKAFTYIVTILLIMGMAVFLYFLYFINDDGAIRIVGTTGLILLAAAWLMFSFSKRGPAPPEESPIKKLVLITRDGEREKEWSCEGLVSLLIGKGTVSGEVDVELGDTHYCEYITNEHAVINYSDGFWYIEDLNSANGVGIKKKGEEYALRLKPMTPYKIEEGDLIYISKAKLLAR